MADQTVSVAGGDAQNGKRNASEHHSRRWYKTINPLKADIVGDFAGKELFAIHGEAMVAHCIRKAKVDFDEGFQLLHAVHAVEIFLSKLVERGCNFHILWFDQYEHLCVPPGVPKQHAYKYGLTRAVLMQHLANPQSKLNEGKASCSYQFHGGIDCEAYRSYLARNPVHFIMCSHGDVGTGDEDPIRLESLTLAYQLSEAGYSVAFIDEIDFKSSKAYIPICTPHWDLTTTQEDDSELSAEQDAQADESTGSLTDDDLESLFDSDSEESDATSVADEKEDSTGPASLPFGDVDQDHSETFGTKPFPTSEQISQAKEELSSLLSASGDASSLSAREIVTLYSLSKVLKSSQQEQTQKRALVALLHLVALRHLKLAQRSFGNSKAALGSGHDAFMHQFSQGASAALSSWFDGEKSSTAAWDAFDLFDGRLYLQISLHLTQLALPESLQGEFTRLAEVLKTWSGGVDVSVLLPKGDQDLSALEKLTLKDGAVGAHKPTVFPFSHPVMDKYLSAVHVETVDPSETNKTVPKIFEEVSHWQNAKRPVDPKYVAPPPSKKQMKRDQRFMANMKAYAASLTGSAGKMIDPEIIVVQSQPAASEKKAASGKAQQQDWKAALAEKAAASKDKKTAKVKETVKGAKGAKQPAKSGKQKALEEAEARRAKKTEDKSTAIIAFWADRCREFEKEHSLTKRFAKARKYLLDASAIHATAIGSEVSLYLCHVLTALQNSTLVSNRAAPDILAMLWAQAIETQRFPMTKEIVTQLLVVGKALDIPVDPSTTSLPSRRLPFNSCITSDRTRLALPAGMSPLTFQMDYCGPYLERSFDSAPDSRVPFNPDAWQRKVLDGIDDDKSLLVVAPTSAGKTFISFYAMKKVLQASNDDVLVYVAPTKALVNQIAAEIQARFSKSYLGEGQEGKAIWAIHTRDYRINNPQKCQILVTVPHILQMMLLNPTNAATPTSWARRVKRIIFDEVHCIGQAEDGIIWEQLLLLAPCPVVALSATVGNPLEFKDWLESASKIKGHQFEMVVHPSRYSDLRKFIYEAPATTTAIAESFHGVTPIERLPFPGLDTSMKGDGKDAVSSRFSFVHPVASIISESIDTLQDITLEPRDCLSLWHAMTKHQQGGYTVDPSLDPKVFFKGSKIVKKSDVVRWEAALKKELAAWMADPKSPFEATRHELQGDQYRQVSRIHTEERQVESTNNIMSEFSLILDLRSKGALPAIMFNYDRDGCETSLFGLLGLLEKAEGKYRESSPEWAAKLADFEKWKKANLKAKFKAPKTNSRGKRGGDDDDNGGASTKSDLAREEASRELSPWDSFDPDAPLAEFSFADVTKISQSELDNLLKSLQWTDLKPAFINGIRRGLGVHHAGMNRQYRQVVEMLFRKGYLTVVVATGTLALGLNMPCKTVVFTGDSVFLSALNYRQASGRAGRRGFDLLGNVVFHGIPAHRSLEIMSSRLPDLRGQFPTSVTLVLRLFTLLQGTGNSEYAANAVKSLLTQTQLYLGGPEAQKSIVHYLRFSIDYLQKQHLLSEQGVPLGLAGLVGHLYFTENSVFAFHSLLNNGYFHKLCAKLESHPAKKDSILRIIVLTLSHLFGRIPVPQYKDQGWLEKAVHRSPSMVILPNLPEKASRILKKHNDQTLHIFQEYVQTYTAQHLPGVEDNELPLTGCRVQPTDSDKTLSSILHPRPETVARSPFAALSGFSDKFATVRDLCETVRQGVFLDEAAIPYIPVSKEERNGVPWNAYLYDFFKHGDLTALVRDNGIKRGDVWFFLKDFSLILATIVTSLGNLLDPNSHGGEIDMTAVQDAGDVIVEESSENAAAIGGGVEGDDDVKVVPSSKATPKQAAKVVKKKKKVDSWDDEEESEEDWDADENDEGAAGSTWSASDAKGESLVNVYKAFLMVQEEFDTKFKKIWA